MKRISAHETHDASLCHNLLISEDFVRSLSVTMESVILRIDDVGMMVKVVHKIPSYMTRPFAKLSPYFHVINYRLSLYEAGRPNLFPKQEKMKWSSTDCELPFIFSISELENSGCCKSYE